MGKDLFDCSGFYSALDSKRKNLAYSWKKVADQAQVSASTLTRMAQGKRPDVDTMAALAGWGNLNVDDFIRKGESQTEVDPMYQISACLRADPKLSKPAAEAIENILRVALDEFRGNDIEKRF